MITITLYTTAGCHLCELAVDVLSEFNINIIHTEISDDDELMTHYRTIIPVIELPNKQQLNWPFTPNQVADLIKKF